MQDAVNSFQPHASPKVTMTSESRSKRIHLGGVGERVAEILVHSTLGHTERAPDPYCIQLAGMHEPVHGHLRDSHQRRHLSDGEKPDVGQIGRSCYCHTTHLTRARIGCRLPLRHGGHARALSRVTVQVGASDTLSNSVHADRNIARAFARICPTLDRRDSCFVTSRTAQSVPPFARADHPTDPTRPRRPLNSRAEGAQSSNREPAQGGAADRAGRRRV